MVAIWLKDKINIFHQNRHQNWFETHRSYMLNAIGVQHDSFKYICIQNFTNKELVPNMIWSLDHPQSEKLLVV